MSLQYQNEPETVVAEQKENFQRAEIVTPVYSIILIAFLILVSLCQFAVDDTDAIIFGGEKSVLLAGFDKPAFAGGEYWRILTGAVLHGGLVHLLFNCYALFVLGKLIEILSNRAHLAIVFLLAAIGGNAMSFVFMPSIIPSVGASGGIVGFLGYLAAYGFLRRKLLPPSFLKNMLFNIGFIALYGLLLNQSIDNFAHLGGLIVGAVYGLIQIPKDLYADPREAGSAARLGGIISLGIFAAVCGFAVLKIFHVI